MLYGIIVHLCLPDSTNMPSSLFVPIRSGTGARTFFIAVSGEVGRNVSSLNGISIAGANTRVIDLSNT